MPGDLFFCLSQGHQMMPGDLLMSILGASFDAGEILFSYNREYLPMPGELFLITFIIC